MELIIFYIQQICIRRLWTYVWLSIWLLKRVEIIFGKWISCLLWAIFQLQSVHTWGRDNTNLFNPISPIDAFWHICSRWLLKTSWQKKKLLKTSNFFFCHNGFNFFFRNYTLIYRDFPYFWVDIFKVVCCRFVACGKGVKAF